MRVFGCLGGGLEALGGSLEIEVGGCHGRLLSNSSPSSTVQSKLDKELTLFSPCHKNKKRKKKKKNLPEQSVLQTWNFVQRLNSQN